MAYTKYSLTPANNNAAPPDGAPEGMLPSAVNDTMRDMMAQIRDCGDGIRGGTYTMTAPVITGGSISGVSSVSTTALTSTNDASISGLTVGKGGGAVSTNTVVGNAALGSNTTGSVNTAIGFVALTANTTGVANIAVGRGSLQANTSGGSNISIGRNSLQVNTIGGYNTAIGDQALLSNTTANYNTALGNQAAYSNTTGTENVAIGTTASGYGNAALYFNTTGSYNTAIGNASLVSNTTGNNNTAIGWASLLSNTTASNNTAVGYQAGYSNTTGGVTVFGIQAGYTNTTGFMTAVGYQAGYGNTTGTGNSSFGNQALKLTTTGAGNTAVGETALYTSTTANYNTAIGFQAGYDAAGGQYNTLVGTQAGRSLTTGSRNTFVGAWNSGNQGSGRAVTTGSANTIIGAYDGNSGGLDIRTASNYIVLSDGDGNPRAIWNGSGVMSMTNPASSSGNLRVINSSNTSGDIVHIALLGANAINTSSYAWISGQNGGGDKCYIYGNGNIQNLNNSYGGISDAKLKENIIDSASQWNDIKNVRVRKYSMKADALDKPNMLGVIAQELEEAGMNGLVIESPDRQNEGETIKQVNYSILYMKAIKALQEAMERIETLEAKVITLENK